MNNRLIAFVLAMIPLLGFSQQRRETEAIALAQEFWGNGVNHAKLKAVSRNCLLKAKARAMTEVAASASNSKQSFYVINDEDNNRFVIVSSDDCLYKILGFSDNGILDAETAPIGLIDMLNSYDEQYASVCSDLTTASQGVQKNYTYPSVLPLIESKWGQDDPYNLYCPTDVKSESGEKCVTGCVATVLRCIYY